LECCSITGVIFRIWLSSLNIYSNTCWTWPDVHVLCVALSIQKGTLIIGTGVEIRRYLQIWWMVLDFTLHYTKHGGKLYITSNIIVGVSCRQLVERRQDLGNNIAKRHLTRLRFNKLAIEFKFKFRSNWTKKVKNNNTKGVNITLTFFE